MTPGALPVDVPLAFGAGLLTIAAPCILPMLPFLLGGALKSHSRLRPPGIVAGFVSAFVVMAYLFGTAAGVFGLSQQQVRDGAFVMLALSGVLMMWPAPLHRLSARLSSLQNRLHAVGNGAGPGFAGGWLLGASMGAVWTPCAGPALAALLSLVAAAQTPGRSLLLLTSYALGAGLPMLAIAYGGQLAVTRVRGIARHAGRIQCVAGFLVVLAAAAMFFQYDTLFTVWITQFFQEP